MCVIEKSIESRSVASGDEWSSNLRTVVGLPNAVDFRSSVRSTSSIPLKMHGPTHVQTVVPPAQNDGKRMCAQAGIHTITSMTLQTRLAYMSYTSQECQSTLLRDELQATQQGAFTSGAAGGESS